MISHDGYYLLVGVLLGFGMQLVYDGIGVFSRHRGYSEESSGVLKLVVGAGLLIGGIFAIILGSII
jgi:hypothetical protein